MSFIGKRIRELDKVESLLDDAYFIVDNGNDEANKVSVETTRDYIITPDKVAGSTVEIQMVINEGKKQIVSALASHGVDASILETFPQLEKKVDALIVEGDKTFTNIPWIYGYANVATNLFPFTSSPFYSEKLNVFFTPKDNGICEVYKAEDLSNGTWIPTKVAEITNGSWVSLHNVGCMAEADDGSIIFASDSNYSSDTGRTFKLNIVRYNSESNTCEAESYDITGLGWRGSNNVEIYLIGESPNKQYVYFTTYGDMKIIAYDKTAGTTYSSDYDTYLYDIIDYSKAVFITDTNLIVAGPKRVLVLNISNNKINVTQNIVATTGYTRTVVYDEVANNLIYISDTFSNNAGRGDGAMIYDCTNLKVGKAPTIVNHTEFKNYNVYPDTREYPLNSVQKIKLSDNLLYINPITHLYNACIYHRDTNEIEFPYLTGFGEGTPLASTTYIRTNTQYAYINPETLTGTCLLKYSTDSLVGINYKLLLNAKNQVVYVENGNTYTLDKPNE